jgi:uncharacterized protein (TIGR02757 family)
MSRKKLGDRLEELYRKYNRREFVHPDPVGFLYSWPEVREREIVAFVASSLAYGRVAQIHKSVSRALERMTPSPAAFLEDTSSEEIQRVFADFKHRVTTGRKLACMLIGMKRILRNHGSLQSFFAARLDHHDNVLPALEDFTNELATCADDGLCHLVPCPAKGSACKRLHLFLRWIVREDQVDPGGWKKVSPSKLIVPVDVHMHRVSRSLGFTKRKQANMQTALEITGAFKEIAPDDPVKYDFVLTRRAIQGEEELIAFLQG